MNEWQPIETAPKDKVVILGIKSYDCGWVVNCGWWNMHKKKWIIAGCFKQCESHMRYSHWMQLPDPPKELK